MSNFNESLGTFKPYNYKSNETGNKLKQRMAGDYMSDFVNANVNDKKDEQKDFTYQGSNGKNYGTNTEKMLFGNTSNDDGKPLEKATAAKTAAKPAAQPAAKSAASTGGIGGIDYGAMADARMATATKGEKNGGVNREYWINQYKKNNSEYEQNKAIISQGPKTYDEFLTKAKAGKSSDDAAWRNTKTIEAHGAFTKYMKAKQGVEHWEKATAKYRK